MEITQEMRDLIETLPQGPNGVGRLCYLGTVSGDGHPNITPRFLLDVRDDGLLWGDNFKNKTYDNLQANPEITLLVISPSLFKGFQFKGRVETKTDGPEYETVRENFKKAGWGDSPVQALVLKPSEVYVTGRKEPV